MDKEIKRMLKLFAEIDDQSKENVISYISGIVDATARINQQLKRQQGK